MTPKAKFLPRASLIIGMALAIAGCGARRPTAGNQPPPLTPSPTPSETETEAKTSTSAEPGAARPVKPGRKPDLPPPVGYAEEGNASWYGDPFNGRRASNGEIYDMHKLTAAHRTLPFNSMVRVTNLNNGKSTIVRITDRGPFVANRIIDLSMAAAEQIESIGPGVVPVRIEVLSGSDPTAGYFTVQVGAFKDENNAQRLKERLSANYPSVVIQQVEIADGSFYRVRVGRISGEQAAQQLGDQLRAKEGFTPFVVRIDDAPMGTTAP